MGLMQIHTHIMCSNYNNKKRQNKIQVTDVEQEWVEDKTKFLICIQFAAQLSLLLAL